MGDNNIKVVVRCRPLNSRGELASRRLTAGTTGTDVRENRARARGKGPHPDGRQPDFLRPTR
jgi:hypothetical protein